MGTERSPDQITYRRTELYEQVWKEPVRTVAKRYAVSDVALGKICRKLSVPLPGLGYWTRIRLGQKVPRPPLPDLPEGAPYEIVHERWRPREAQPKTEPAEPPIVVPETLHNPHKLVSETSRVFRGVRSAADRCLDISVSKESRSRALRIMNALLRALEKRGLKVEITRSLTYEERQDAQRRFDDEVFDHATRVLIDGEWVKFGIWEKGSVVHVPAPEPPKHLRGRELESWIFWHPARRDVQPNGTLELIIKSGEYLGVRRTWHDGKRKRVEECLNDFITHVGMMAAALKRRRAERIQAELERHEEDRRRREEEQRRREEVEREARFAEKLDRWRLARDAREYAREARALVAAAKETIEEGSPLYQSLKWAESWADSIDPLTALRDEVTGDDAAAALAASDSGPSASDSDSVGDPTLDCH